jgi:hypothetical protein
MFGCLCEAMRRVKALICRVETRPVALVESVRTHINNRRGSAELVCGVLHHVYHAPSTWSACSDP